MTTVVLYFPYIINMKAFLVTEKLNDITIDPANPFLKIALNDKQIEKACFAYGARLVS